MAKYSFLPYDMVLPYGMVDMVGPVSMAENRKGHLLVRP